MSSSVYPLKSRAAIQRQRRRNTARRVSQSGYRSRVGSITSGLSDSRFPRVPSFPRGGKPLAIPSRSSTYRQALTDVRYRQDTAKGYRKPVRDITTLPTISSPIVTFRPTNKVIDWHPRTITAEINTKTSVKTLFPTSAMTTHSYRQAERGVIAEIATRPMKPQKAARAPLSFKKEKQVYWRPGDSIRIWLIKPGRLEFLCWLCGLIILISLSVLFLFMLAVNLSAISCSHKTLSLALQHKAGKICFTS